MTPLALVTEVAAVLQQHGGDILCVPTVERTDGIVRLTIAFNASANIQALSLYDELKFVADMANVRAFAATYGIDPAALEAVIQKRGQ